MFAGAGLVGGEELAEDVLFALGEGGGGYV